MEYAPLILAIESSCDETSAAVLRGTQVLSNLIATQKIHERFGGVVPELASRAHQANIVPVVHQALNEAQVALSEIEIVGVTQGPGLMGALHVGFSFAKSLALSLNVPLVGVNHMEAHVLAHFARTSHTEEPTPSFPFLCLTVSGGHTQMVWVKSPLDMEVVAETIDDAAGEAFDKAAKVLGLPYPGGPLVDKLAQIGDPLKYKFTKPTTEGLSYSFSGLKTSLLYFLRDQEKIQPEFKSVELNNICASYQHTIVEYLLLKFRKALEIYPAQAIALAGGVSANSLLRKRFIELGDELDVPAFIPPFSYCTDNAAMIGVSAFFKSATQQFLSMSAVPAARMPLKGSHKH